MEVQAMARDIPDDLDWHTFPEGEEPKVITGISTVRNAGKHDECPGHGEHEGQVIFCRCACHEVPHEA
jgi:hypothetical protein